MSIINHFTRDQARQFGEKFGIDWQWSRPIYEPDPVDLDLTGEEFGRQISRVREEAKWPFSSAKFRPVHCSKTKNPSRKMS